MRSMPGNPHADDAMMFSSEASLIQESPTAERGLLAQQAVAQATIALAYEQRTANLIALASLTMRGGLNRDYDMETIYNRLGLGENDE